VGLSPKSLTSADFNGDGKIDLVTANSGSNNLSVLLAIGTGSFAPAVNFTVGSMPYYVITADFNADGNADLATANYGSNYVSILLGTGTGSFAPALNSNVGSFPISITSADFNADSKLDLAIAYNSNGVSLFLGNGTGSFVSEGSYAVNGSGALHLLSADFNTDGKADLATANNNSQNVSVLLNLARPSVTATSTATLACPGASSTITAVGATTYQWSSNTGNATTASIIVTPTITTSYTVIGTAYGCTNVATITQNVGSCVGIHDLELSNTNISIYPNPTHQSITINFAQIISNEIRVEFLNSTGQLVLEKRLDDNLNIINLSELANGLYVAKVLDGKKVIGMKKIVKE
jgi:hypothetical protein